MNEQVTGMIKDLDENYLPIIDLHLNDDKYIYLGDKKQKKCRFCGKQFPDVTFKKVAHAIPEFIGNKRLVSFYECDYCNIKFSGLMESHLANYMNLYHTLSQVKGKNGIPSFKSNKKKSRIDMTNTEIKMDSHEDDEIFELDEDTKTLKITGTRATYVPIAIYKCLTKMALSIMPDDELNNFKNTFLWINEEDHSKSNYNLKSLNVLFSFVPSQKPFNFISCLLYKRKPNHKKNVPYMMFLLAYGNYSFQIYLPLCIEDSKYLGNKIDIIFIPTPFDIILTEGLIPRQILDMNSTEQVKGEKVSISMGYESMEDKTSELNNK